MKYCYIFCKAISLSLSLPVELVRLLQSICRSNECVAHVLWRVLFIVPLRYLFAIGFRCMLNKHQYLAFDVSLPPPNYLSCSPKQLDSGFNIYELRTKYNMCIITRAWVLCNNITIPHKTWLSHSMAVEKLQWLLSNAKRCVFESVNT